MEPVCLPLRGVVETGDEEIAGDPHYHADTSHLLTEPEHNQDLTPFCGGILPIDCSENCSDLHITKI